MDTETCQFCRADYICHEHTVGTENVTITKLKPERPDKLPAYMQNTGPSLQDREAIARRYRAGAEDEPDYADA